MESLNQNFEKPSTKPKSSERMMRAIEIELKAAFGKIDVIGRENIEKLPYGGNIVVVPTHIADQDIPLSILAVGRYLDLVVSNQSPQHSLTGDTMMNVGMRVAGRSNFLPIDYIGKGVNAKSDKFNTDNFIPMVDAMDNGKAVLVAGHNPSKEGHLEKGGYGAAYLAEITNATILPVSVDVLSSDNLGNSFSILKTYAQRPNVNITIGEPFALENIPEIKEMNDLMHKRKNGERLTEEEFAKFKFIAHSLREQSAIIMQHLAMITPVEKRGDITV